MKKHNQLRQELVTYPTNKFKRLMKKIFHCPSGREATFKAQNLQPERIRVLS